MVRPDASDLLRAAIQQPTRLPLKHWGARGSVELWGGVLPGGRPGRALREKTLVAAVGGGRLIIAGLSSGRTCSTGVRAWVFTAESWGHTGAVGQPVPPPPCPVLPPAPAALPVPGQYLVHEVRPVLEECLQVG